MKFTQRLALKEDLQEISNMFKAAIKLMESQGIHQWDEIYPNEAILYDDILKKQLYLCFLDNNLASAFVLNNEFDKEYDSADWKYTNCKYIIVHRLCVNPEIQNKGFGNKTVRLIENIALKNGFEAIRLDCFTGNPFAFKLYQKLGYAVKGYANFRKGKFYLMEKSIKKT